MSTDLFKRQSQSFTATGDWNQLQVLTPFWQRPGTTGGTYTVYLYNFNAVSLVPTTLITTLGVFNYTDLPTSNPLPNQPTEHLFTGLSLSNGTSYAVAWFHTTGSGTDGANVPVQSGNPYTGGNQAFDFSGGGTWTAASPNDLSITINGATV